MLKNKLSRVIDYSKAPINWDLVPKAPRPEDAHGYYVGKTHSLWARILNPNNRLNDQFKISLYKTGKIPYFWSRPLWVPKQEVFAISIRVLPVGKNKKDVV